MILKGFANPWFELSPSFWLQKKLLNCDIWPLIAKAWPLGHLFPGDNIQTCGLIKLSVLYRMYKFVFCFFPILAVSAL